MPFNELINVLQIKVMLTKLTYYLGSKKHTLVYQRHFINKKKKKKCLESYLLTLPSTIFTSAVPHWL